MQKIVTAVRESTTPLRENAAQWVQNRDVNGSDLSEGLGPCALRNNELQ